MELPHGVMILVCDGKKALTLRNQGDAAYPNLEMVSVEEQDNPPTHVQGADRPGRYNDSFSHTSAVEETDWHRQGEDRFAAALATKLRGRALEHKLDPIIVVAPPRMLGTLRREFGEHVNQQVVAELPKDLVNHEVREIERILHAY